MKRSSRGRTARTRSGSTRNSKPGAPLLTDRLYTVVHRAWLGGFHTKSNFARFNADYTAIAVEAGLITTRLPDGDYGRKWWVTPRGLKQLWARQGRRT